MLIIEDGTLVANANSWVTRAGYIAYALTFGIVIPDDDNADIELITAGQFINQHEANLKGDLVSRDQSMSHPRTNLVIDGWSWESTEIARQVILCQQAYALDIHAGIDLYNPPQNPNLYTKKERVEGAVSVEYAISEDAPQKLSRTSTGDALLSSLLESNGLFNISLVKA